MYYEIVRDGFEISPSISVKYIHYIINILITIFNHSLSLISYLRLFLLNLIHSNPETLFQNF